MNDSFLTALTALFKKYSKKQLATMSFVEFTILRAGKPTTSVVG